MLLKRLVHGFVMALLCAGSVWAAPRRGSTLGRINELSYAEASRHMPVSVTATVTYFRSYENLLFVQDGDVAIYVKTPANLKLVPGDRVLIRGTSHESFRSYIQASNITLLHHGAPPAPVAATYRQMIRGEIDCRRVRVRALIRAADLTPSSIFLVPDTYLQMLVDGAHVDAHMDNRDGSVLKDLLDAEVEITGVVSGHFDNKMQQTGVLFHIQSPGDVKVLRRLRVDPWSLPVTPMDRVIIGYQMRDLSERMRVRGTITYYQPGTGLVLQDGGKSLWITAQAYQPLKVGDLADATGFPDVQNGFLALERGEVRDKGIAAPVAPAVSTWRGLAQGGNSAHSRVFDLVALEGQVVTEVRQATEDEYVLTADGHLVSAILRHPGSLSRTPLPEMKQVPVGARVRVTGICMLANADPFYGDVPFSIVMRSFDDVVIVKPAPWLDVRHLLYLVGLLLAVVFTVGARIWSIERRMRRQTAKVAEIEKRRSRILEGMNASRALADILAEIMDLVSFQLEGAPCWCEIADGMTAGRKPQDAVEEAQVERHPMVAPFAPELGTICVLCNDCSGSRQTEAVSMAAGLIALAVETSRLHADLVHRSEFDLLTDIHNRFSLETALGGLIEVARGAGTVFGLIYLDLNEFKGVNDRYGHRCGDAYLKKVTARMQGQLRPEDTLARVGGDEFAVLAPRVRCRGEAEEIALRLERCYDDPFAVDGNIIRGSASIGLALYPEDGTTKDALLNAADAAMYVEKRMKQGGCHPAPAEAEDGAHPVR